jgi:hypothetical protein
VLGCLACFSAAAFMAPGKAVNCPPSMLLEASTHPRTNCVGPATPLLKRPHGCTPSALRCCTDRCASERKIPQRNIYEDLGERWEAIGLFYTCTYASSCQEQSRQAGGHFEVVKVSRAPV